MRTASDPPDDSQRRDLLAAVADDTLALVIGELRLGERTQGQIATRTQLSLPAVSRSLRYLRALGLVRSGLGKGATHELLVRDELFAVLIAADRLADRVNEQREHAQREAARQTIRDQLRGDEPVGGDDAASRP